LNVTVALPVSKAFWVQILLLPIMLEISVSSGAFRSNDTFLLLFFYVIVIIFSLSIRKTDMWPYWY
jgi:hypothetical protein